MASREVDLMWRLKGKEFQFQDLESRRRKTPFVNVKKSYIRSSLGFRDYKFDFRHVY